MQCSRGACTMSDQDHNTTADAESGSTWTTRRTVISDGGLAGLLTTGVTTASARWGDDEDADLDVPIPVSDDSADEELTPGAEKPSNTEYISAVIGYVVGMGLEVYHDGESSAEQPVRYQSFGEVFSVTPPAEW